MERYVCIFAKPSIISPNFANSLAAFPETLDKATLSQASSMDIPCNCAKSRNFSTDVAPIPRFGTLTTRAKLIESCGLAIIAK